MQLAGLTLFQFVFLLLFTKTNACGTSTHISIAHEASIFFKSPSKYTTDYAKIIKSNQDAFVAGNPYPDAMYPSLCYGGKYHQVAEDTHWAPFLNATVNFVRKNYKEPWSEEAKKLLAFTFGYVSHQVADVSWHSLGIDQGFIRAMADVNFNGVFGAAHSVADAGGDMVSQLEGDDDPIHQYKWHVPSDDLFQIYKEFYGSEKVSQTVIESCAELLYLEWLGEKLAGSKLFKLFAKKSSFLEEQLHNYFLGGIHDMASWTAEIWMHVATLIEGGTDACKMPTNTLFITCNKTKSSNGLRNAKFKNPGRAYPLNLHNLSMKHILRKKKGRGIDLQPDIELSSLLRAERFKKSTKMSQRDEIGTGSHISSTASAHPYSETGRSLLYVDSKSFPPTLFVGAPNYGQVAGPQKGRVLLINSTLLSQNTPLDNVDIEKLSYGVFEGLGRMTKFGWSIAVIDLNKDGFDDIAISAPSSGAVDLKYTGAVHIYFGKGGSTFSNTPDVSITGNETFDNFGYVLKVGDINQDGFKDLIIGSPFSPSGGTQRGRVDFVIAQENKDLIKSDLTVTGSQDYEWFGYDVGFVEFHKRPLVLFGAPAYRKCSNLNCTFSSHDIQEKGRVYVYDLSVPGHAKLLGVIEGPAQLSQFGASLAIGQPFGTNSDIIFAVGAPSIDVKGHLVELIPFDFKQAGSVYLFNLTSILERGYFNVHDIHSSEAKIASFSGDRSYGRFGMSLDIKDVDDDGVDDLIIGSPYRTEDITEEISGAERGALYIFKGGKDFLTGDVTSNCGFGFIEPCPGKKATRTIYGDENNARFASSMAFSKRTLFVSSPRSNKLSFHGGAFSVIPA